jgi:hypothetical protein
MAFRQLNKEIEMKRVLTLVLVSIFLTSGCAFADWGFGGWGHHDRYRYHDGGYWLGGALVTGLALGAIIESLPPHATYVNGYYYDGTYYYQQTPNGYIVVQPTQQVVIVQQPVCETPRDLISVDYRGMHYFVHGEHWFQLDNRCDLIEVRDPTR